MSDIRQESEMLAVGQVSTAELARVLIRLIKCDPEVGKAILGVVQRCPNIMMQF